MWRAAETPNRRRACGNAHRDGTAASARPFQAWVDKSAEKLRMARDRGRSPGLKLEAISGLLEADATLPVNLDEKRMEP
jgi:hypothetical protein